LTDAALAPVWQGLRGPLERGASRARLPGLPRPARHALAGLLGRPVIGVPVLDLGALSADLQVRAGIPLADVVATLTGPLRDLPADRAASALRRGEPLELLGRLSAGLDRAWVPDWLRAVRASGSLTREPEWERVVRSAVQVLREVLAGIGSGAPPRSRTELAAACAGDAHALDVGAPVAGLVLRALALEVDEPWPLSASARRSVWDRVGVLPDLVSQTVLTLGLRGSVDPVHLTAWDLRREPLRVAAGTRVLVCENPAVLEAAARAGRAAVVCGFGSPSLLCLQVLDELRAGGAALHYHGDFDWPGIAICNRLIVRCGVLPWRMGAADYREAVRPECRRLSGHAVAPTWDAELGSAMQEEGAAVHEEQILASLVSAWRS
jgi:uncharacterized protein (TIGR02679 family)